MNKKPDFNIYEYTDYKLFLRDYYSIQKKSSRRFSYRYFAQKANVAASVFKDVISGRRNLTLPVMHKYAVVMGLSKREVRYFETLVRFVNSKKNDEKNQYFAELIRMRGNSCIKFLGEEHYIYYSKWYHSAIRELVTLPEFREDPEWIAHTLLPSITPTQAKKSIELLLDIGILQRDTKGILVQKDSVISSEYEMASEALCNFHSQMIDLAGRSNEHTPREKREISSLTLGVSQRCVKRLKERIRIFKEDVLTMVLEDQTDSETVYQLNFQLFPLIKKIEDTSTES